MNTTTAAPRDNAFYLFDGDGTPIVTLTPGPQRAGSDIAAVLTASKGGAALSEDGLRNLKRVVDDLLGEPAPVVVHQSFAALAPEDEAVEGRS